MSCSLFWETLKKCGCSHEWFMLFARSWSVPDRKSTKCMIWFKNCSFIFFHCCSWSSWLCCIHLNYFHLRHSFFNFSCWFNPNWFSRSSPVICWNRRWMKSSISWCINLVCCVEWWTSFPTKLLAIVEYRCLWIHF